MSEDQIINQYKNLKEVISRYNPSFDEKKLDESFSVARRAHKGQKRLTGHHFIVHPIEVATYLAEWKLDTNTIIAGILHDTIEDGDATREELVEKFGEDVALLVDGVTKVTNIRLVGSSEAQFVETLRKMILVMAKDLRVVLLKLADRLHNMKTLYGLPREKQYKNALETIEIYCPLAERLGIGKVKGELQDLAFPYLDFEAYQRVKKNSAFYYKKAEKEIVQIKKVLLKEFAKEDVAVIVQGRRKHLYSLWKKLLRDSINWDFDKVHDIIAFRILVDTVKDCYISLGIVHKNFKPYPKIPLSDYIAQPKPNGYRSIHTKVFGPQGKIIEVQIRTHEMHEQAEFGAAAHWAYAEAKSQGAKDKDLDAGKISVNGNKLNWVKQLVQWQKEISDSDEFLEAVKLDAFTSRILVFSPKGDVYDLPEGATPIDYAFAVHTNLPNFIGSVLVNGKIVPLDFKLSNGDLIFINKSKQKREVKKDWLNFAVSNTARSGIRKQLRKGLH